MISHVVKQLELGELSAFSSPSFANLIIGERGQHNITGSHFLEVHVVLLMLRGFDDQGNNNGRRLWESNKKSLLQAARAWLQRLSNSPSSPRTLSIPPFTSDSPEAVAMSTNPMVQSPKYQFFH